MSFGFKFELLGMRYISACTQPYEMQFDMASMTTIKNIHTVEKTIKSDRCGHSFHVHFSYDSMVIQIFKGLRIF